MAQEKQVQEGAAVLTLVGEYQGSGEQHWKNQNTGDSGKTTVLVFKGDSVAYPEKVRVGKDSVGRALAAAPAVGEVGRVVVFAGKFGELWFKAWAN